MATQTGGSARRDPAEHQVVPRFDSVMLIEHSPAIKMLAPRVAGRGAVCAAVKYKPPGALATVTLSGDWGRDGCAELTSFVKPTTLG